MSQKFQNFIHKKGKEIHAYGEVAQGAIRPAVNLFKDIAKTSPAFSAWVVFLAGNSASHMVIAPNEINLAAVLTGVAIGAATIVTYSYGKELKADEQRQEMAKIKKGLALQAKKDIPTLKKAETTPAKENNNKKTPPK